MPSLVRKAMNAVKNARAARDAGNSSADVTKILTKKTQRYIFAGAGCGVLAFLGLLIVVAVVANLLSFVWSAVVERVDNTVRGGCILCTDEELAERKETQFVNKIEAVKNEYGAKINAPVLASTILYQKNYNNTIDSLYDEDYDEETFLEGVTEFVRNFTKSSDDDYNGIAQEQIDLIEVATAIMVNSAENGVYNEENYKEALASNGMSVKAADNFFLCTGMAIDSVTDTIAQLMPGVSTIIDAYEYIKDGTYRTAGDAALYSVNKYAVCTVGFIGATFPSVYETTEDDTEASIQIRKNQIADEIISFAQYYEYLFGEEETESTGGNVCYYNIPGIDEEVSNIKVQTINCEYGNRSGSVGDDTGEELIDFETTYIAGVVYAEVGGGTVDTKKAQAVAARSYALTRGNAMNGNYNIGLSIEGGQWVLRIRTCTSDQVFCHPTLGCGSQNSSMQGTTSGGYTVYAGGYDGNPTRAALSDDSDIWTAVNETKGEVAVTSSGEVAYTTFVSNDQNAWASAISGGKTYKEAIIDHYDDVTDVTSDCRGVGNYDLESYYEASQAATLPTTCVSNGKTQMECALSTYGNTYTSLQSFKTHIIESINSAGFGTRAGVVAAAIALIGDYSVDTGLRLNYVYGGGHSDWSSYTTPVIASSFGIDCSAFVSWAIYQGGYNISVMTTGGYISAFSHSSIGDVTGGQAGDVLVSSGHIVMILGTYDDGYYCAEASSTNTGLVISKRSYSSLGSYYYIDMESYYSDSSNVRSVL